MLRIVGWVSLICAAFGLLYSASSGYAVATGALDGVEVEFSAPYTKQAFLVITLVFSAMFLILGWCGLQFVRLRTFVWPYFTGVLVLEVVAYLLIGLLWNHAQYGMSIAAATGAAGGVVPQYFILLPIWGPIATRFAARSVTT